VYSGDGTFLKTMQMRNLVRAVLRPERQPVDGKRAGRPVSRAHARGKAIGAIGNGMGIGHGQFIEASY
jgi:hypothetical protein